jgi:uncharacterized protein
MIEIPDNSIDFHVHLFPDELFDAIWAFFRSAYGLDIVHKLYSQECIDYLRERGIAEFVYSNYAHRKGIAGPLNDWNLQLLDRTDSIYCFAAFHPDDEDALQTACRVISHPKVIGFKLHFLVQNFHPDDERLFPLYEMVINHNKRLLLHIGTGPIGNEYTGISRFRKVLERYPYLPANIAHMGAFEFREFFDLLALHPNLYLDTSYCFLPGNFRMYKSGNENLEAHKHRLLYGSDFPNLFHHRDEEITALLGMGLSPEFYECLFRTNAKKLLTSLLITS